MKNRLFHFIDSKTNQPTKQVQSTIFDATVTNQYDTLKQYLEAESFSYTPAELKKFIRFVEQQLYDQVYYLAYLMYHIMENSNDWGEAGEQQIKIAFCRNILKIPIEKPLTDEDATAFFEKIESVKQNLGIAEMSLSAATHAFNNHTLTLFQTQFRFKQGEAISKLLRFIGSKLALHYKAHNMGFAYILGESTHEQKAEFDVIYLKREIIRTPNYILANAAIAKGSLIFIREESLETVFYQKWMAMFEPTFEHQFRTQSDDFWNLSAAIKQHALALYGVTAKEDLLAKKDIFMADLRETIVHHELGHGILKNYILPIENICVGEGTHRSMKFPIYEAVLEFLTDFTPEVDTGIWGPLWNMVKISKTDKNRAERMFYMYFSDVWFYDTEDDYMFTYSDFMSLALLKYIGPRFHVDFHKLEKDMIYHHVEFGTKKVTPSLIERLYELFWLDTDALKTIVKEAKFNLTAERDFNYVKKLCLEETRKFSPHILATDPAFLSPFWINIFAYIQRFSAVTWEKVQSHLKNQEKVVMAKMMVMSAGRKRAEEFSFEQRRYIPSKMKELGFSANLEWLR